jgi:hypothetical protein
MITKSLLGERTSILALGCHTPSQRHTSTDPSLPRIQYELVMVLQILQEAERNAECRYMSLTLSDLGLRPNINSRHSQKSLRGTVQIYSNARPASTPWIRVCPCWTGWSPSSPLRPTMSIRGLPAQGRTPIQVVTQKISLRDPSRGPTGGRSPLSPARCPIASRSLLPTRPQLRPSRCECVICVAHLGYPACMKTVLAVSTTEGGGCEVSFMHPDVAQTSCRRAESTLWPQ